MELIKSNERRYKRARRKRMAKAIHERDKVRYKQCPWCGSKYKYTYREAICDGYIYSSDLWKSKVVEYYILKKCETCGERIWVSVYINKETGEFVKER